MQQSLFPVRAVPSCSWIPGSFGGCWGCHTRLPGQDTTVRVTLFLCSFSIGISSELLIPMAGTPFTATISSPHLPRDRLRSGGVIINPEPTLSPNISSSSKELLPLSRGEGRRRTLLLFGRSCAGKTLPAQPRHCLSCSSTVGEGPAPLRDPQPWRGAGAEPPALAQLSDRSPALGAKPSSRSKAQLPARSPVPSLCLGQPPVPAQHPRGVLQPHPAPLTGISHQQPHQQSITRVFGACAGVLFLIQEVLEPPRFISNIPNSIFT